AAQLHPERRGGSSGDRRRSTASFAESGGAGGKALLAVRNPDVLDLGGAAQELAALRRSFIPAARNALVGPDRLQIAGRRLFHHGAAGLRAEIPERGDVVVLGQRLR